MQRSKNINHVSFRILLNHPKLAKGVVHLKFSQFCSVLFSYLTLEKKLLLMNPGVPKEKPLGRGARTNNKLTFVVTFWIRTWGIPAAGKCFHNSPTVTPLFSSHKPAVLGSEVSFPTLNLKNKNNNNKKKQ